MRHTACAGLLWLLASAASAQVTYRFDLPQQALADSLRSVAQQTSTNILFEAKTVADMSAPALAGSLTAGEAIERLLAGSGLSAERMPDQAIIVQKAGKGASKNAGRATTTATNGQANGSAPSGDPMHLAQGENPAAAAQPAAEKLEEVIVTAQKRQERIQDVPMAITALSGDTLARSGITSSKDLLISVPGLTFKTSLNVGSIGIRGVSSSLQGVNMDPSAAVYIDGVYQPRFETALFELMDTGQVEVLKGPQVVLYGRNATAGAISVTSNEPGRQFGGNMGVEAGNEGLLRLTAALDIPVSDRVLVRASGMSLKRDGLFTNVLNPADHPGRKDTWGGRLTVKFLPADGVDFTLRASRIVEDGSQNSYKALNPAALGSAYDVTDPYTVSANQVSLTPTATTDVSGTLNWNLGPGKLTSIAGYGKSHVGPLNFDADSIEFNFFTGGVPGSPDLGLFQISKTFTEETYYTAKWDRLDWIAGAAYLHEKGTYGGADTFGAFSVYFPAGNDTKAYAGYTQLGYAVTDRLKLSGGVRYSHEKKVANRGTLTPTTTSDTQSASWSSTTPTFTASYHLRPNHMLYATAAKGFKSGGFNQYDTEPAFNPETIRNYEVGAKSSWLDGRISLDASVYRYDYKDLQVLTYVSQTNFRYENAGAARGKGAELAARWLPIDGLTLDAGVSFIDATFTDYRTAVGGQEVDYTGHRLASAPRFASNLSMAYRAPLGSVGHAVYQLNFYHSSLQYFEASNDPGIAQPAYSLLNARVSYQPNNSNLEIGAFGRNLTNKLIFTDGFSLGVPVLVPADPRSWGFELRYSF